MQIDVYVAELRWMHYFPFKSMSLGGVISGMCSLWKNRGFENIFSSFSLNFCGVKIYTRKKCLKIETISCSCHILNLTLSLI